MKVFFTLLLIAVAGIFLLTNDETRELKLQHENHIVKKHQTWNGWEQEPITQRISTVPDNVIDYIRIDNKIYGYDGIPKQVAIDPNLKKDLISAIEELPKQITKQLEKHLIGIFILSGLGSTGFSEHVYNKKEYKGGFIVLDQDVLSKYTANEWASWSTNSAFKKSDEYKLSLKIEESPSNTRKQAIQFILIHEIAHIIAPAIKAHPQTDKGDPKLFEFSSFSWTTFNESIYDENFKHRQDFNLYRFEKSTLELSDSHKIMSDLKNTNFSSMYASNNFFEDFAEAYVIYVHSVLMKKPYTLTLYHHGNKIESFKDPFMSENLQEKKEYFDKLFLNSSK